MTDKCAVYCHIVNIKPYPFDFLAFLAIKSIFLILGAFKTEHIKT